MKGGTDTQEVLNNIVIMLFSVMTYHLMTSYEILWHPFSHCDIPFHILCPLMTSSIILCQVTSFCTTYNITYILHLPEIDIARLSNFLGITDCLTHWLTIAIPHPFRGHITIWSMIMMKPLQMLHPNTRRM